MNAATINGRQYEARFQMRGQAGTCAGCAANDPTLTESERQTLCLELPPCMAAVRPDGRFVVWVKQ